MTFKQWIFTDYDNGPVHQWGIAHILTLVACIAIIVSLALIFKNKSKKAKNIVIGILIGLVLFFEIARRVVNFVKAENLNYNDVLYLLLPRPWCAMACWSLIISLFVRKDWFYNFASMTALLCAIIFFAYPGVGFHEIVLFDDLYSIATHSLLLVTSITLITLKFTNFSYKNFWKFLICYAVLLAYTFLQIYVLKTEADPMYFMPGNDVQEIFGVGNALYTIIYIAFSIFYFNLFYLIQSLTIKKTKNIKK